MGLVLLDEERVWVADGNYSTVRDVLWSRATHVVWLNYGRFTAFSPLLWAHSQPWAHAHPSVPRQPRVAAHGIPFTGLNIALGAIQVFDESVERRAECGQLRTLRTAP